MSAGCSVEFVFFFFSSRRRHTRYWRDWSSDVCSSDLKPYSVTSVVSGVPGHQRPGDLLSHLPHFAGVDAADVRLRSEEHTSELQSRQYLVCRLLLEKK